MAASRPTARDDGEAYATLVAGDGPHACLAAVLGHVLRRLDPGRPRAALVINASLETRRLLTAERLWDVHNHKTTLVHNPQSFLRVPLRIDLTRTWGFPQTLALQPELWALPFRRVVYFDADHVPTADSDSRRLRGLWRLLESATLAALPEHGNGCFNSGMMLLRPGEAMHTYMRSEWRRLAHNQSHPDSELMKLRKRCPSGWNGEQPMLNHAFARSWTALNDSNWRCIYVPKDTSEQCHTLRVASAPAFAQMGDSVHYFYGMRPWAPRGSDPDACALYGLCEGSYPDLCGAVMTAAAAAWWRHFVQLPTFVRATCRERFQRLHSSMKSAGTASRRPAAAGPVFGGSP